MMMLPESPAPLSFRVQNLSVSISKRMRLTQINLDISAGGALSVMGPVGSGKSELLWAANGMLSEVPNAVVQGLVKVGEVDVTTVPTPELRHRVGLLVPTALARTPFAEVAMALRHTAPHNTWGDLVEQALRRVGIWRQVRDHLHQPYNQDDPVLFRLLCLARTLALAPGLLLLDDPTRGLDSIGRSQFEDAVTQALGEGATTMVWCTREPDQAGRVAHRTAFLCGGQLVEIDNTESLFEHPNDPRTESFLTGDYRTLHRLATPRQEV